MRCICALLCFSARCGFVGDTVRNGGVEVSFQRGVDLRAVSAAHESRCHVVVRHALELVELGDQRGIPIERRAHGLRSDVKLLPRLLLGLPQYERKVRGADFHRKTRGGRHVRAKKGEVYVTRANSCYIGVIELPSRPANRATLARGRLRGRLRGGCARSRLLA